MLSQHAVETNHRSGKLDMLSQHTQQRHAIPAYTAKINLQKPQTSGKLTQQNSCTTRRTRTRVAAEQASTMP